MTIPPALLRQAKNDHDARFAPFARIMRAERLPEIVIETFEHYYQQLRSGNTGLISENQIQAVKSLPDTDEIPAELSARGEAALSKTALLKLNGGLGTSMGLEKAKSLLLVKDNYSFLDIIALQSINSQIPLVLMNSFSTQEDSLRALDPYRGRLQTGSIPIDFLQHKVPKISQADLSPASWPDEPELEWCPPGHGDIYTALLTSGMLDTLIENGFETLFVSNADNLGAVIDKSILGYFVDRKLPFMMEVAERTEADKKGGHLAGLEGGQLILRESAQCPPEDESLFQDINRHQYFNTNNLWINLQELRNLMSARNNNLGLAMIVNSKSINPRDKTTTPVYQLETAMGAAIAVFNGAGAIRVPRNRFAPIKTSSDLLDVRSDNYVLDDDFQVIPNPARKLPNTVIDLDSRFYQMIDDLEARFPHGVPGLLECERLTIHGDIEFGRNVRLKGEVTLHNDTGQTVKIADNAVISGDWNARKN